jgi:hypothetical protein
MQVVTLPEQQTWSIDLIGSQISETALLRIHPTTSQFTIASTHHHFHSSILHIFNHCSHYNVENEPLSKFCICNAQRQKASYCGIQAHSSVEYVDVRNDLIAILQVRFDMTSPILYLVMIQSVNLQSRSKL